MPETYIIGRGRGRQLLDRRIANAPRRIIDDTLERLFIVRVHHEAEIGNHILHLFPLVERQSAIDTIRDVPLAQCFFQQAGLRVGPVKDGIILVFVPLGKLVILASGETFLRCGSVLREALRRYKLLTALDVTDVSSLFAFDDGIAGVVALGTEAAELGRYFAGVRNLPCIAIPDVICSERLLGETVDVPLGGKRVVYPAPPPRLIYVDVSLLCGAAEAYGKICSWALSLLDLRFSPDDQPRCGELYELALSALGGLGWYESDGVQKIFESDFRLAYCAREGLERGAVRVLAEETGSDLFALVKLATSIVLANVSVSPRASPIIKPVSLYCSLSPHTAVDFSPVNTFALTTSNAYCCEYSFPSKSAVYDTVYFPVCSKNSESTFCAEPSGKCTTAEACADCPAAVTVFTGTVSMRLLT